MDENIISTNSAIQQLVDILLQVMLWNVAQAIQKERLGPQLPAFSAIEDERYVTSQWLGIVDRFSSEEQSYGKNVQGKWYLIMTC